MKKDTGFGKSVKIRLIEIGKNQKWLINQVREKTGMYFDGGYLWRILNDERSAPSIVKAMRRHSTATLMGMTKKELVEYVRMAEHNQEVAEAALNQQAENVKDWYPVRHGRWIPKSKDGSWRVDTCSSCRKDTHYARYAPSFDYCPNCGAKMDKGE